VGMRSPAVPRRCGWPDRIAVRALALSAHSFVCAEVRSGSVERRRADAIDVCANHYTACELILECPSACRKKIHLCSGPAREGMCGHNGGPGGYKRMVTLRTRCASYCAWFSCAEHTGRAHTGCVGTRQGISVFNTQRDGAPDSSCKPPSCVVGRTLWVDPQGHAVRIVLVYGVPLLVARLPAHLREGGQPDRYRKWIRRKAPSWRRSNGGILQVSYGDSKNSYNVFREARKEGGAIAAFGDALLNWTCSLVQQLMANLGLVASAMLSQRLRRTFERTRTVRTARSLVVYSWANVFHSTGPHAKEAFVGQLHTHQWAYHGFFVWNGSGTNTSYWGPAGRVFNILQEDNTLTILPGGFRHAALHPGGSADPRITQAFDIDFDWAAASHGMVARKLGQTEKVTYIGEDVRTEIGRATASDVPRWGGVVQVKNFFKASSPRPRAREL